MVGKVEKRRGSSGRAGGAANWVRENGGEEVGVIQKRENCRR